MMIRAKLINSAGVSLGILSVPDEISIVKFGGVYFGWIDGELEDRGDGRFCRVMRESEIYITNRLAVSIFKREGFSGEKVCFGFKSKNQLPLFMVWREFWEAGEVVYGDVLFNSQDWFGL